MATQEQLSDNLGKSTPARLTRLTASDAPRDTRATRARRIGHSEVFRYVAPWEAKGRREEDLHA
jgi:hypothetical protein